MRGSDGGAHGDACGRSCEVHLLCAAAELRPSAWTGSCVVSARVSAPDTDSASLSSVRISQAIVGSPRARLAFLPALRGVPLRGVPLPSTSVRRGGVWLLAAAAPAAQADVPERGDASAHDRSAGLERADADARAAASSSSHVVVVQASSSADEVSARPRVGEAAPPLSAETADDRLSRRPDASKRARSRDSSVAYSVGRMVRRRSPSSCSSFDIERNVCTHASTRSMGAATRARFAGCESRLTGLRDTRP